MLGVAKALAHRAGLTRVPTPVLVALLVACLIAAASGFARWGESCASEGIIVDQREATMTVPATTTVPEVAEPVEPEPEVICIHVVGAVLHPGVYEVLEGARVADAIVAAGGLAGNAAEVGVNLARLLADGEQIVVPTEDEWAADPQPPPTAETDVVPSAGSGRVATGAPVNINTATASEFESLPGIGPVIAARIVEDRAQNGPFASVDELVRVSGIGDKTLENIRPYVTVGR